MEDEKREQVIWALTKNNRVEKHGVNWPLPLNDQGRKRSRGFKSRRMLTSLAIVTPKKIPSISI